MVHDLLEDALVVGRVFRGQQLLEREETTLEHPCLQCTIRLVMAPRVESLLLNHPEGQMFICLPPGANAEVAARIIGRKIRSPHQLSSYALVCDLSALEDNIWDTQTLFESGISAIEQDQRSNGEFLIAELDFVDTVLPVDVPILPPAPAARKRGALLLKELAPGTSLRETSPRAFAPQRTATRQGHEVTEQNRKNLNPNSPFATITRKVARPLHPDRWNAALATLAQGCCRVRGKLWIAGAPDTHIHIEGIGPRVWMETITSPTRGLFSRESVLTVTGEAPDGDELAAILADCELTPAEMTASVTMNHTTK